MKVIILAAGKGNRLLPITEHTPKPLIKISGISILDRILASLPHEITEIILVVGHLKEKIYSHISENHNEKNITCVEQSEMKGTFGALLSVKNLIQENERFLIINGDDIHDKKELEQYLLYPRSFGLQKMHMPKYYNICLDTAGYVEGFRKQTETEQENGTFVATGAYVVDSHIFDHPGVLLSDGEYGLPQTLLAQKDSYPLKGIITTKWLPINSIENIETAESKIEI